MGHSMGSFITRLYTAKYPNSMNAVIIHGTGGPNPLLGMGKALASVIKSVKGPRHRSSLIEKLAFGSYNSKFPKSEGKHAWLTRDVQRVAGRDDDKFTNFKFTVSGFIDLFTMLGECNSEKWYKEYPKDVSTLIISGDMDPVGNYGKGPDYVYKQMLVSGCEKVILKMYKGARHELFNETNREEVYSDLLKWIKSVI
jgi:alpha-beta hydrolase superfamily lysophospholipase